MPALFFRDASPGRPESPRIPAPQGDHQGGLEAAIRLSTSPRVISSVADTMGNATISPGLRYRDAPAAIDWLCKAFGFEPLLVVPADGDLVAHAQLTCGNGMIMLGSHIEEDEWGKVVRPPDSTEAPCTSSICVVVDDADIHHDRAVAAGARVIRDLQDEDYGGRGYACRDPEGQVWYFGTYNPWGSS